MAQVLFLLTIFIVIILILNFLRHRISREIQIISLLLFKNVYPGVIFYSLFFLPGIIIHELSHFLMASLLGVQTGNIVIFPAEIKPGNTRMGSVESAQSDPIRESLIGFAPFIIGVIVIFITGFLQLSLNLWQNIILLYLLFSVVNTMFVSKEDTRSWWGFLILGFLICMVVYLFNLNTLFIKYLSDILQFLNALNRIFWLILLLDFSGFVFLYLFKKILQNLTGFKVELKN
ncbi:MAG: hypothetical protein M1120_03625 [Patescibacteria group bacterium]|nr:hypothetical protein [Patescibacteria group bacterium]